MTKTGKVLLKITGGGPKKSSGKLKKAADLWSLFTATRDFKTSETCGGASSNPRPKKILTNKESCPTMKKQSQLMRAAKWQRDGRRWRGGTDIPFQLM